MANLTFLGLPQEMRDEIYRHLLVPGVSIKTPRQSPFYGQGKLLPTAILRVNKQIYAEAYGILLKENSFFVTIYNASERDYQKILQHAPNLHVVLHDHHLQAWKVEPFLNFNKNLRNLQIEFRLDWFSYWCIMKRPGEWAKTVRFAFPVLGDIKVHKTAVVINSLQKVREEEDDGYPSGPNELVEYSKQIEMVDKALKELEADIKRNNSI